MSAGATHLLDPKVPREQRRWADGQHARGEAAEGEGRREVRKRLTLRCCALPRFAIFRGDDHGRRCAFFAELFRFLRLPRRAAPPPRPSARVRRARHLRCRRSGSRRREGGGGVAPRNGLRLQLEKAPREANRLRGEVRGNKSLEVVPVEVGDFHDGTLRQRLLEHLLIPALEALPSRNFLLPRVAVEDVIRAPGRRTCPNVRADETAFFDLGEVADENLVVHRGPEPARLKEGNAVNIAVSIAGAAGRGERESNSTYTVGRVVSSARRGRRMEHAQSEATHAMLTVRWLLIGTVPSSHQPYLEGEQVNYDEHGEHGMDMEQRTSVAHR